jgi:putative hydrolase of the HAD superfamily
MFVYRRIPRIQAMTFDLDDTLYDNRPVIRQLEYKMTAWMHLNHPVSTLRSEGWWKNLRVSLAKEMPALVHDVTQWRFQRIMRGLMLLGYSRQAAENAAHDALEVMFYWRNQIEVPEQTHAILGQLAQQVPLVAITNGNADPDKIGLGDYFQTILRAGADGFSKPHSALFFKAVQYFGLPASGILHVGDHLENDVYGAKQSGLTACWYNEKVFNIRLARRVRVLPDIEINRLSCLLHFL